MINISRKLEYALMILNFFEEYSSDGLALTAREISLKLGIPFDTTSKVLQKLNSNNIVSSTQGVRGGYVLTRPIDQISYKDLYESIEGQAAIIKCDSATKKCEYQDRCSIIPPLKKLSHITKNFYQNISIGDLLNNTEMDYER